MHSQSGCHTEVAEPEVLRRAPEDSTRKISSSAIGTYSAKFACGAATDLLPDAGKGPQMVLN
jgi:hypothetical protein